MSFLLEPLSLLIEMALLLLFLLALTSPLEALSWWASGAPQTVAPPEQPPRLASHYLVYLTGVGGFSGDFLARREHGFLERLQARLPGSVMVADVFPFSVNNNPLDGERLLAWLWRWLQRLRLEHKSLASDLFIAWRNVFQVAVSADPRYGPIYNLGVARELARHLVGHGYPRDSGIPVVLIGYSGGVQVAVGAAPFLKRALRAPIRIVSIGGALTDDPGIASVQSLIDLRGSRDFLLPGLPGLLYPGRWPFVWYSAFNRAVRRGRVRRLSAGPMHHSGKGDYFSQSSFLPDGTSFADHTADLVSQAITGNLPDQGQASAGKRTQT